MFHDAFQNHSLLDPESAKLANLHLLDHFIDHWFNTEGHVQKSINPINSFCKCWPCLNVPLALSAPQPALSNTSDISHQEFAVSLQCFACNTDAECK